MIRLIALVLAFLDRPTRARQVLGVYWVMLATGSHWPNLGLVKETNQFGVFQVDKTLHVAAFAGLTYLLFAARVAGQRASQRAHLFAAVGIAMGYALIDEYTQQWTGRDLSLSDVVAGYIGIVGVFLLLAAPPSAQGPSGFTRVMRIVTGAAVAGMVIYSLVWSDPQPWTQLGGPGHFGLAAGLTLMLAFSQPAGVHRPRGGLVLSILVIGLAGPIIETALSYTGRAIQMAGLYAHQSGMLAAMTALALLSTVRVMRTRFVYRPLLHG